MSHAEPLLQQQVHDAVDTERGLNHFGYNLIDVNSLGAGQQDGLLTDRLQFRADLEHLPDCHLVRHRLSDLDRLVDHHLSVYSIRDLHLLRSCRPSGGVQ